MSSHEYIYSNTESEQQARRAPRELSLFTISSLTVAFLLWAWWAVLNTVSLLALWGWHPEPLRKAAPAAPPPSVFSRRSAGADARLGGSDQLGVFTLRHAARGGPAARPPGATTPPRPTRPRRRAGPAQSRR